MEKKERLGVVGPRSESILKQAPILATSRPASSLPDHCRAVEGLSRIEGACYKAEGCAVFVIVEGGRHFLAHSQFVGKSMPRLPECDDSLNCSRIDNPVEELEPYGDMLSIFRSI